MSAAHACMILKANPALRVEIADEEAIILWDAHSKTEHFIRRSSFRSEAKVFGFLVPTPTQPTLAEVDNEAFSVLDRVRAPQGFGVYSSPARLEARFGAAKSAPPAVQVLETKRVAGLDATVLKATSPDALNHWLKEHEYQSTPELRAWLKPYVERSWIVTAFKFAKDQPSDASVHTLAVRMTFNTEAPFHPYREPPTDGQSQQGQRNSRLLRVYFIGTEPVRGRLGETGFLLGETEWSDHISCGCVERYLCRRYAACLIQRIDTVGLRPRLNSVAAARLAPEICATTRACPRRPGRRGRPRTQPHPQAGARAQAKRGRKSSAGCLSAFDCRQPTTSYCG
ncbi:MAG TPA: DUF2330 domain-containing protein [Pirellulales bacterium]|nr:DUF2330 domain-containing protein [Pirellulales bacterium]